MDFDMQIMSNSKNSTSFPQKDNCRVLILGCGNSRLGEDMMKDGWRGEMANVDFSNVVIKQMKERYNDSLYRKIQAVQSRRLQQQQSEEFPKLVNDQDSSKRQRNRNKSQPIKKMTFEYADVTKSLPFPDENFDLVLCKGTLDSILCSNGSMLKCKQLMAECHRVLHKSHGILAVLSFGTPDNRLLYFEHESKLLWHQVDVHKVPKCRGGKAVEGSNSSK